MNYNKFALHPKRKMFKENVTVKKFISIVWNEILSKQIEHFIKSIFFSKTCTMENRVATKKLVLKTDTFF